MRLYYWYFQLLAVFTQYWYITPFSHAIDTWPAITAITFGHDYVIAIDVFAIFHD